MSLRHKRWFPPLLATVMLTGSCDDPRVGHAYPRLDPSCEVTIDGRVLFMGTPACYRAYPMEYISGTWVSGFEYSAFYTPGENVPSTYDDDSVWLDLSANPFTRVRDPRLRDGVTRAFRVSFLGIDPKRPGHFGHGGISDRGIYVHHFTKIEELPSR